MILGRGSDRKKELPGVELSAFGRALIGRQAGSFGAQHQ
jgi:hypothetical protein